MYSSIHDVLHAWSARWAAGSARPPVAHRVRTTGDRTSQSSVALRLLFTFASPLHFVPAERAPPQGSHPLYSFASFSLASCLCAPFVWLSRMPLRGARDFLRRVV